MTTARQSLLGSALVVALASGLVAAAPERAEAVTPFLPISFLTSGANAVGTGKSETTDMSFLATRSQRKDLTRAGVGPFTMTHTNADPTLNYSYLTDVKYGDNTVRHSGCSTTSVTRECAAQLRESDLRAAAGMDFRILSNDGTSAVLYSDGNIASTPTGGSTSNTKDGFVTFGAIFGPDVWSEPFEASASAAVSVEWTAAGDGDDYEIYGFLVAIDGSGGCSASSDFGGSTQAEKVASHEILIYSRGKSSTNALGNSIYNTANGVVSTEGCYRFRLVNGTYDASGGFYVGAEFGVRNLRLGQEQTISFTPQSDLVKDSAAPRTIPIVATSNAQNATITYTTIASQNGVCAVDASGVMTIAQNKTGFCSIAMNSASVDSYAAAETTYLNFTVLEDATAPVYSGGAAVSGQATICSTLTAVEGSWSDGGQAVSSTTYQWQRDGSAISGATNSTYVIQDADLGTAISFVVSKTNSVGTTNATSNALVIVDARLVGLTLDVTTGISPTFAGCTTSYTTTTVNDSVTVTATMNNSADSLAISGSAAISAQATAPFPLDPGANTIPIVVTTGAYSLTYTVTVTYAAPPSVQALAPTFTDGTQATLSASIDANGYATSNITFTITPTNGTSGTPVQGSIDPTSVTGNSSVTVEQDVTGLVSGGFYTFQVSVTNANGTSTDSISFQTPDAPSVITGAASNVAATTASVSYEVSTFNRTTAVTFSYSVNPDMSSPTEISVGDLAASGVATTGTVDVTGLSAGTTYYYTFSALNDAGTNTGVIRSFTTFGAPVVAVVAGEGGERTALLKATVNAAGLATSTVRFYYSTDSSFASSTSVVATPSVIAGSTATNVQARISNLAADTYYYKVEAVNSAGTTLSSTFESVTVVDSVPTVTLSAPVSVANGGTITVTVRFSETVTGFLGSDLVITGVTGYSAQAAQNLGNGVYSVNLTTGGANTGTMTIALNADAANEEFGPTPKRGNLAALSITVLVGATPPGISFQSTEYTLVVGNLFNESPANSGGSISTWTIVGTLPDGLGFNTSTGAISGTPTSPTERVSITISGENSGGTSSVTIGIRVLAYVYWNGPHVQQVEPTVLITSGGETVTLYGLRLNRIDSVEIEGITITITVTSNKQVSFVTPSMSPGVKNLKLHGTRVGKHEVVNAVMVVEPARVEVPTESPEVPTESPEVPTESPEVPTESPEVPTESPEVPTESPEVPTESPDVDGGTDSGDPVLSLEKRVLSGFAPGSSELTQELKDRLVALVSDLGTVVAFSCVGYTQGPTVLEVDIALSLARGQVVCDELKLLFPDAEVRLIVGRQDNPVGTPIRRTEIYFIIAE